jgi:rhomboid protease GluP
MSPEHPNPAVQPVDAGTAGIPVRSQRQAMDWGLVLLSQGIQSVVHHESDTGDWALLVEPNELARSLQILRQYHIENRHWPWQQQLRWHAVQFDWASLVWALVLAIFYWVSTASAGFTAAGIMDGRALHTGQWWRLFTAIMLHADLGHLLTNLSVGVVLLGLAMGRYGTGVGLLTCYLAGAAGNLLSLLFHGPGFLGLGASGMMMGALGMIAAQSFMWRKVGRGHLKEAIAGVAAGFMLFVLFGLSPGSDIAAHLGGFLSGVVLGAILAVAPPKQLHRAKFNLPAGLILTGMVIVTWRMALR